MDVKTEIRRHTTRRIAAYRVRARLDPPAALNDPMSPVEAKIGPAELNGSVGDGTASIRVTDGPIDDAAIPWYPTVATGGAPQGPERGHGEVDLLMPIGHSRPCRKAGEPERIEEWMLRRDSMFAGRYAVKLETPTRIGGEHLAISGHRDECVSNRLSAKTVKDDAAKGNHTPLADGGLRQGKSEDERMDYVATLHHR